MVNKVLRWVSLTILIVFLTIWGAILGCSSKVGPETNVARQDYPLASDNEVGQGVEETPSPPAAVASPSVQTPRRHVLALMPLGDIPDAEVEGAARSIEDIYGWEVRTMERRGLLASAYYQPRKRYRAEKLLRWLGTKKPDDADMIMGLTTVDISTTKGEHQDWGICGLADMGGPGSVVSTFRIKRKLPGKTPSIRDDNYNKRLRDLTAHEFGHQLGLDHCPNEGCIMEDAKGTVTTFNRSTGKICDDCVRLLEEAGWGRIDQP